MPRLKLTLEYDGGCFLGWQVQAEGPTVQGELERALAELTGEAVRVAGSGRTDSGVHARAQVASFDTESSIPPEKFPAALNSLLPEGVSVLACEGVPADFHARYSARRKLYRYVIICRRPGLALDRERAAWVPEELDTARMIEAAGHFVGEHDFRAFATDVDDEEKGTVREVIRCDIERCGEWIEIDVEGTGFLRKMVRTIVGTLIDVGRGHTAPGDIPAIIESRDRKRAGPTAPPQGLYLVEVKY